MTRTILRTTIRKKLGESTAVFWADTDLNQWMEDAQLDLVWKAKCKRARSTATSVASTVRYTLSDLISSCLRIFQCKVYNSSTEDWSKVTLKTRNWLDANYPHWDSADTGTPMYYAYSTLEDELILYPAADSDHVGADYIEFYNSTNPTIMSSDGASPDLPTVLHPAVIDYVVATGLESRGYQDIANTHWQMYFSKLKSYMTERELEEDEELVMRPSR